MRNVCCADCGKRYDYDVDDFCPRCGSFNPPPDSGATRLEEELLSRFQRPETVGRPGRRAVPRSAPVGRPVKKKESFRLSVLFGLALLVILTVVLPLAEAVLRQVIEAIFDLLQVCG